MHHDVDVFLTSLDDVLSTETSPESLHSSNIPSWKEGAMFIVYNTISLDLQSREIIVYSLKITEEK